MTGLQAFLSSILTLLVLAYIHGIAMERFHLLASVTVAVLLWTNVLCGAQDFNKYNVTNYRLFSKTRAHAGIVEAYISEIHTWGIICNGNDFRWNFERASVVCDRVGYPGTAFAIYARDFDDQGDEWPLSIFNETSSNLICSIRGAILWCRLSSSEDSCLLENVPAVTCKGPGYLGCFKDPCTICYETLNIRGRTLSSDVRHSEDNTIDACITWCNEGGYLYAGVEDGGQCFCGNDNYGRKGRVDDSECITPCTGDTRDTCGGSNRISVYEARVNTPSTTATSAAMAAIEITTDDGGSVDTNVVESTYTPNTPTPEVQRGANKGDSAEWIYIAIAVVLAAVLVIIIVVIVILLKRRNKSSAESSPSAIQDSMMLEQSLRSTASGTNVYEESGEHVPFVLRESPSDNGNHSYSTVQPADDGGATPETLELSEPSGDGDVYTNTDFHTVPSNMVENDLYRV